MGAPAWASPRLCRLLLSLGVFLLLLYLASLRLPAELPLSACVGGGRPCHWLEATPLGKEDKEELPPGSPPAKATKAALTSPAPPGPQRKGTEEFQVEDLLSAFAASVTPLGDVLIAEYLRGWQELLKFMDSLGAAFRLVSQETSNKVAIMRQHQAGRHGPHYRTVQSMVAFELSRGLVHFRSLPANRPPSGCRTLLRLHRALKWLELFLHKLGTSTEVGDPSQMCSDAYREALAPYHSWWVRQVAALAFLALPSRHELYRIICTGEEQEARALLLATVQSLTHVYNLTQDMYAAHGMLQLP